MTIEEMLKESARYSSEGDIISHASATTVKEMWLMTAEICKRLEDIEASSHDHQAN